MVEEGKPAPDFELTSDSGDTVKLSDLRGKPVVLYFYPKDDTPGCTTQACAIRDSYDDFAERGAVVLGVSPDTETSHVKFKEKYGLPFTLLADPEHEVAEKYGDVGRAEELRQDVHGHRALDVPDRQRGARREGDAAREARHARRAGARGAAGLARRTRLQFRFRADVAELVDAHGSGPCGGNPVEVQVLSSA